MRIFGSRNCIEFGIGGSRPAMHAGFGLCMLAMCGLGLAACASDGDSEAGGNLETSSSAQQVQAKRDLVDGTEDLSAPLVSDTVSEGAKVGAFLGSIISSATGNESSVGFSVNYGSLGGSLAGRYVAEKQEEYGAELEVIDAITRDVEDKNRHAERTIQAMEVVVAEDRARLEEIRKAREEGKLSRRQMAEEIAFAERDLETMRRARDSAEEHLETFVQARSIVLEESEDDSLEQAPEMDSLDSEIEILRGRINVMHQLVDELSRVS